METRCPSPACNKSFSLSGFVPDKRNHYLGNCPSCGIRAKFRTEEALEAIEVAYRKKLARGGVTGGPEREESFAPSLSVLVEDVRSLWNIGSIFRTADGAGFERIYLTGICGSPPRKEIAKVSLGAEETVSWLYELNPLVVLESLKSSGVFILGLEVSDDSTLLSTAIEEGSLNVPLCLVLGNEVSGLSPQVMDVCDRICHLPMKGMKESLNVAVAFGIAAYLLSELDGTAVAES